MPSKYFQLNDVAWLRQRYIVELLSTQQIAKTIGCAKSAVYYALQRCCIYIRTKSEAQIGELNYNFGKTPSEETIVKMRKSHIGVNAGKAHYMYGKHHSAVTKQKQRDAVSGEGNGMYGKHHSAVTKQKQREHRRTQQFPRHHTKPELQFEAICAKYNLPFRYTGNSALWIGLGERKLNPDFVGTNGNKKVVVEIFGDWFHNPTLNPKVRESATYEYRFNHFKKAGYHMIVFWESELKTKQAEQLVLGRLGAVRTCAFYIP